MKINAGFISDHSLIKTETRLGNNGQSPGFHKFSESLLLNKRYIN